MKHRKAQGADARRRGLWAEKLNNLPVEVCPTPHKVRYAGRKEARAGMKRLKGSGAASSAKYSAYRCRCGGWHVGGKPATIETLQRIREDRR